MTQRVDVTKFAKVAPVNLPFAQPPSPAAMARSVRAGDAPNAPTIRPVVKERSATRRNAKAPNAATLNLAVTDSSARTAAVYLAQTTMPVEAERSVWKKSVRTKNATTQNLAPTVKSAKTNDARPALMTRPVAKERSAKKVHAKTKCAAPQHPAKTAPSANKVVASLAVMTKNATLWTFHPSESARPTGKPPEPASQDAVRTKIAARANAVAPQPTPVCRASKPPTANLQASSATMVSAKRAKRIPIVEPTNFVKTGSAKTATAAPAPTAVRDRSAPKTNANLAARTKTAEQGKFAKAKPAKQDVAATPAARPRKCATPPASPAKAASKTRTAKATAAPQVPYAKTTPALPAPMTSNATQVNSV